MPMKIISASFRGCINHLCFVKCSILVVRDVQHTGVKLELALIGGGEYSYLLVLPDEFLLKSAVIKFNFKEIRRAEHEYMNVHPPPPINALVSPLPTY